MSISKSHIEQIVPDERDLALIRGIAETGVGRAFIKAIEAKRDHERYLSEINPKICDEVKHDLRYKLGMLAALNWILELPIEIKNKEKL